MTRSDLIKRLAAANPHLYLRDVERIVSTVLEQIGSALARGHRVELRGFGVFSIRMHGERVGRNPRTGDEVAVPGKVVPHFKVGKELLERLNLLDGPADPTPATPGASTAATSSTAWPNGSPMPARGRPRPPVRGGCQAANASGVTQTVKLPRCRSALSYAGQLVTR